MGFCLGGHAGLEGPGPGRQAVLPLSSRSRRAVRRAGRADPPFVVALGAAGLAGWPGLAHREDHSRGACSWRVPWPLRPGRGQAETTGLVGTVRFGKTEQTSWAGSHWPGEGGGHGLRVYVWYLCKYIHLSAWAGVYRGLSRTTGGTAEGQGP